MRLIDADSIRGCAKYIKTNEKFEPYIMIDDLSKLLEEQQTIYSVDKVVEELRELKMRYFITIANTGDKKSDFAYENVGNALDKAIEIVKHVCVSDDVCEWK